MAGLSLHLTEISLASNPLEEMNPPLCFTVFAVFVHDIELTKGRGIRAGPHDNVNITPS
jgi:hypothetical protein